MKKVKIIKQQKSKPSSYYAQHLKSKEDNGSQLKISQKKVKLNGKEINLRNQKIKNLISHKDTILQNIKIDQSFVNSHNSNKKQALLQIKQIQKTIKSKQNQYQRILQQNIECQQEINSLEIQLRIRQGQIIQNKQKLFKMNYRVSQETADTQYQKLSNFQKQMQNIVSQNQREIIVIKQDKKTSQIQIQQLRKTLSQVQIQRQQLQYEIRAKRLQKQNSKQKKDQQRLKQDIFRLQKQNNELQLKLISLLQQEIYDQGNYRFDYIDIIQKLFYQAQIQKIHVFFQIKEKQIVKQQEYQKNKDVIKDIKKEIKKKQNNIQEKNKIIDKLTFKIMEKSNQLLEIHQYSVGSPTFKLA